MKTNILKSLVVAGMCALPFAGHAQKPTAELINGKALTVQGDSVKFEARIKVPKHKVFKQEGVYIIMPELGDTKFPQIKIPSSELANAARTGIDINIKSSALFDEDMIGNDLEIEHEYAYRNGTRNTEFADMDDVAECCVTTGTLFATNGQYEIMKYDYIAPKTVPLKVVSQVNFPLDIANFSNKDSDQVIRQIGQYLKQYPNATIKIKGFASPEGTKERNQELAEMRTSEVVKWVKSSLNKWGYGNDLKWTTFSTESVTEDWEGFEYLLSSSDLSEDKQNEVRDILNDDLEPEKKEKKVLAALGGIENADKYLMPLRRTTIVVSSPRARRIAFSSTQIDSINSRYNKGDMTLSAMKDIYSKEELLEATQRPGATSGKITLLNTYYKTYPGDYRSYSNLGSLKSVDLHKFDVIGGDDALIGVGFSRDLVDIDTEFDLDSDKLKYKYKYKKEDVADNDKIKTKIKIDLNEAEVLLMKAYHAEPDNFVSLNNLGAYFLTIGEYRSAKRYLDKSSKYQDSEGVNYNLGVYQARMGNYEEALAHFNKAPNVDGVEYNRGLAKLMTGDNNGALKDLERFSVEQSEYALGHYLTAVAAARIGKIDVMVKELEHAMNRNQDLSDIASEDLEFRNYWNNDKFKKAADDNFTPTVTKEK